MHIKIQKGSPNGVTNNKGSCRNLAEYINHEDAEREARGLWPFPYIDPSGNEIATEEVIKMIDENARGLAKNDNKFFHIVVAPSPEEIQKMGEDEQEIYLNALYFIKLISRAYAKNFHREGIYGEDDLVIYWKPHFTRGDDGYLQFHLHAIVSRKSKGISGKKQKISPLTNHRENVDGPIEGGFNRKAFMAMGEMLFDQLFCHEREVAKSFDYQNTIAHGTVEEKAVQADRLAKETLGKIKESIAETAQKQQERPTIEMAEEEYEALGAMLEISNAKGEILNTFHGAKNESSLYLSLVSMGIYYSIKRSKDGIEDVILEKGGITISATDIFTPHEHYTLMANIVRLTGEELAEKVRERRARQMAEKEVKQHKYGGPKMRR